MQCPVPWASDGTSGSEVETARRLQLEGEGRGSEMEGLFRK